MPVGPGALAQVGDGVAVGRASDPGKRRDVHELVHRLLVGRPLAAGEDAGVFDRDLGEPARPASRGPLPEPAPVVLDRDARRTRVDHCDDAGLVTVSLRGHADPVGEVTPGAVVLHAVQHPGAALTAQFCRHVPVAPGASLRPRAAYDRAASYLPAPVLVLAVWLGLEPVLHERDVVAPDLRLVGVGGGKVRQESEELSHARPAAALRLGQAQRTVAGRREPANLVILQ
jgi:hypothetical protein